MSEIHPTIAKVTNCQIGFEDHGIFGIVVDLDYGRSAQSLGWYGLAGDEGYALMKAILRACNAKTFDQVKGRTVYALRDGSGLGGLVRGLAPLPTERGTGFLVEPGTGRVLDHEVGVV